MGHKAEKQAQRQEYKRAFTGVKHNHGGLAIKKKAQTALTGTANK